MSMNRSPLLRATLLALLVLGMLVRPMLALACEIHAVAFAHASQPHAHEHEAGADDAEAAHGVHESLNLSALAAAAELAAPLGVPELGFRAQAVPPAMPTPLDAHYALAPFRPPIA
jgi:hypothetical protein